MRWVIAIALGVGGVNNIVSPEIGARFVAETLLAHLPQVTLATGVIEVTLATLLVGRVAVSPVAFASAVLLTSFAVLHSFAAASGVEAPCGCLGRASAALVSPFAWIWINALLAVGAACASAFSRPAAQRTVE